MKAIMFDFDGVILESADIKTEAFAFLFKEFSSQIVERIVAYHTMNMGVSRYKKFRYIYENILEKPLTKDVEEILARKFTEYVFKRVIAAPLVKGVENFLESARQHYKLFVVSGTPQEELIDIVTRRNLKQYFTEIHGTPRTKPEIILDILRRFTIEPSNVIFIGDAKTDQNAAIETGVGFIARIAPGNGQLLDCTHKILDFCEIEILLNKL